ncbi:hypothetical protein PQG44_02585 [Aquirufa sp. LEPPI-3A]|uniref:DUF6702 family protein n=1 Tax=Aquirufa regiilacus TaxID=3024868 RepID=UPI0028DECF6A|nr:DUF6702 family protein [Aquirufa sp. LEPPI-3A]MDT8886553.1 hypothetical protein [Aquirufa sp. LEPPI-3A]
MTFPLFGNVHPFHSSVGECVYNPKEKVWEISIRLFQDDLEQGLTAFTGKRFVFLEGPQTDNVLEPYLRKHLGVQVNQQLTTPYRYLGWESVKDVIWVYVEVPTEQQLKGMYWENSLLAETFPDQTNLFHVARGEQKHSYLFQENKWIQLFD